MLPDPAYVFLVHAAATWGMTSVIWFIQLVHYPAYRDVGPAEFSRFQDLATARTGFIVGPLMVAEAGTAVLLLWHPLAGLPLSQFWIGLPPLAVCWLSTLCIQVPLHFRLKAQHSPALIDRLLLTNWIRTLSWTARAILVTKWLA